MWNRNARPAALFALCTASAALAACGAPPAGQPADQPQSAACAEDAGGLSVADAWVRAAAADRPATAAYLTICNGGENADALTGVASEAASAVELHETVRDADGVTRMGRLERLDLPPGQAVSLAPGGAHVMLIGLNASLDEGTTVPLTLEFASGQSIAIDAAVRSGPPASQND